MKIILTVIALTVAAFVFFYVTSGNENKATRIDAETFKQKHKENPGLVIDVRTKEEFNNGHLELADHNYDFRNGEFKAQIDNLTKDETYYLYCRSGNRSGQAAKLMKEKGFEKVYNIGGFQQLVQAGLKAE
ncbi:MAG: rhodanese-like domain-containing protein [Balneolaceae bacterium]|nr:rhodanese-like domain-containing protein [Balneolaceae bacterium]